VVCVGNTAAPATGRNFKWTFIVAIQPASNSRLQFSGEESKYISRVVVKLHPTYTPQTVVITSAPFLISRHGWGLFPLQIEIQFHQRRSICTTHHLSFDPVSFTTHALPSVAISLPAIYPQRNPPQVTWNCPRCTLENFGDACQVCQQPKPLEPATPVQPASPTYGGWTCHRCTLRNEALAQTCSICAAARSSSLGHSSSNSAIKRESVPSPVEPRAYPTQLPSISPQPSKKTAPSSPSETPSNNWVCPRCTFSNQRDAMECTVCLKPCLSSGMYKHHMLVRV
jgi:hypothetical protein